MQLHEIKIPNTSSFCDTVNVTTVNSTEHLSAASIHVDVTSYFVENGREVEECSHGTAFVLATGKDRIEKEIRLDRKLRTKNPGSMLGWSITITDEDPVDPDVQQIIENKLVDLESDNEDADNS